MTTRTLAILIFDDVEVLDFCGPFEVFSVANRFTDPPAFNLLTVAEKAGPVVTRSGLSANPHHRLTDCPQPDLLLVPGGQGTRKEMHNPVLIERIKLASEKEELVLSVCTGALLLAKGGLLDGLEATTHHGAIDLLRQTAPKTTVQGDRQEDSVANGVSLAGWVGSSRLRLKDSIEFVARDSTGFTDCNGLQNERPESSRTHVEFGRQCSGDHSQDALGAAVDAPVARELCR